MWLLMPVLLFISFWYRAYISLPVIALTLYSVYRIFFKKKDGNVSLRDIREAGFRNVAISWQWWIVMTIGAIYVLMNGIGGLYYQAPGDHWWRNAVLYDLCYRPWPIVYNEIPDWEILTYYLAYWLPAAGIGNLCHSYFIGSISLYLYSVWGVFIILNLMISISGEKPSYWLIVLLFIFFDAWEIPLIKILHPVTIDTAEDIWSPHLLWMESTISHTLPCNRIMLSFTYNQGFPTWVAMLLMWHQRKDLKTLFFTYSLLFPMAPFPFMCLLPYMAYLMVKNIRITLTLENITGIMLIGVTALYFMTNSRAGGINIARSEGSAWAVLKNGLVYTIIAYGVYLPFIWEKVKGSGLFWSMMAVAFVAPFIQFNQSMDLGNRIGFPLTIYITVALCQTIPYWKRGVSLKECLFWVIFCIGGIMPAYQLLYGIRGERRHLKWGEPLTQDLLIGKLNDQSKNCYYDNFIGSGESFYVKWMMPRKEEKGEGN